MFVRVLLGNERRWRDSAIIHLSVLQRFIAAVETYRENSACESLGCPGTVRWLDEQCVPISNRVQIKQGFELRTWYSKYEGVACCIPLLLASGIGIGHIRYVHLHIHVRLGLQQHHRYQVSGTWYIWHSISHVRQHSSATWPAAPVLSCEAGAWVSFYTSCVGILLRRLNLKSSCLRRQERGMPGERRE